MKEEKIIIVPPIWHFFPKRFVIYVKCQQPNCPCFAVKIGKPYSTSATVGWAVSSVIRWNWKAILPQELN